jgi:dTDP-4-dehydrorhamnose 3,5-epimerase
MGNKLEIQTTSLEGLCVIKPLSYEDERGMFSRIFCADELKDILNGRTIQQINHSMTYQKGAVRGLHFQYPPDCEVKIVKCIKGSVLDVVVDIRENSKTFLQTFMTELSAHNHAMVYIPEGFAHGFQTLEDECELLYLHTSLYTPTNEGGLNVADPLLAIKWSLPITDISTKDKEQIFLDPTFRGIIV